MGLYAGPLAAALGFVHEARDAGRLHETTEGVTPWPEGAAVVLAGEARGELGHPVAGSALALLWDDRPDIGRGRIWRIGSDLSDIDGSETAFAMFVLVSAASAGHDAEFDAACRDAFDAVTLRDLSIRRLPGRQAIWCRLHRDAATPSFAAWGAAVIDALGELPEVNGVDVLFVTGDRVTLGPLPAIARDAGRLAAALRKMTAEPMAECDKCEYWDICASVEELRRLRRERGKDG